MKKANGFGRSAKLVRPILLQNEARSKKPSKKSKSLILPAGRAGGAAGEMTTVPC
jgi:hypothetical protein